MAKVERIPVEQLSEQTAKFFEVLNEEKDLAVNLIATGFVDACLKALLEAQFLERQQYFRAAAAALGHSWEFSRPIRPLLCARPHPGIVPQGPDRPWRDPQPGGPPPFANMLILNALQLRAKGAKPAREPAHSYTHVQGSP